MRNVTIKVSDTGFDKAKYVVRISPITAPVDFITDLTTEHDVKFELQDSLEKVTISGIISSQVLDWVVKALKELPLVQDLVDNLLKDLQTTQFTVNLDSKNREATVKAKFLTIIKLNINIADSKQSNGMAIGSGTTSGTIEVSGGVGEGKPG